MGVCRYCKQDAGWFRAKHAECDALHRKGRGAYHDLARRVATRGDDAGRFASDADALARKHYLSAGERRELALAGWRAAVESALDDHVLSAEEEKHLAAAVRVLGLPAEKIHAGDEWTRLAHFAVLRDLHDGKVPTRMKSDVALPFNFQKSEQLVWVFQGVPYYEERTRMTYRGGSQGVSIRIASGLYYRVGGFKGERVPVDEVRFIDAGLMAVTTKHVYFSGERKSFRVPFAKMVEIRAFEDGIRIQRDALSAKPMLFQVAEVWFAVNLINQLAAR